MSNYVNVTVNYAAFSWDTRFNLPAPENISAGIYEGLEACAILDKILISKEFSDKVVAYVSTSFSFKLLTDFLCKLKDNYINVGLAGIPTDFRVYVEDEQDSHCDIVDDRNYAAKMSWMSMAYTLKYQVISRLPVVFGYLDIVFFVDEDWNLKYKAVTDNTDFNKQVLGDFSVHSDIVSAKLEAESLYTKYLKAWVAYANSNYLTVAVLGCGSDSLMLQTSVGDMLAEKVSQDISNTGRRIFTGYLILPWSETRVPFVDCSVDELASLVNGLIARKVEYDLNKLADKR